MGSEMVTVTVWDVKLSKDIGTIYTCMVHMQFWTYIQLYIHVYM